jgi:small basic protein
MRWGGYRRSLFDSVLMNFASFIGLLLGLGPYIASSGPWGLTLFGTYSTMVEGAIVMLLERHPAKKVWLSIFVANAITCIVLLAETLFLHFHGPIFKGE